MTLAAKSLADGQVGTSTAAIFTASAVTIVRYINFYNTNASTQTLNVYITRSGSARRQIYQNSSLAQYGAASILGAGEVISLSAGDKIEADTTTGTAVDYIIAGASE